MAQRDSLGVDPLGVRCSIGVRVAAHSWPLGRPLSSVFMASRCADSSGTLLCSAQMASTWALNSTSNSYHTPACPFPCAPPFLLPAPPNLLLARSSVSVPRLHNSTMRAYDTISLLFQGYFVRFDDIPKFWIWGHYISYQKYAFEALCKNEFDGLVFNCDRTSTGACNCFYLDDLQSSCQFRGETVLAAYGYEDVSIVAWVMVLLGMAFIYRIIFWLLVEWHAHRGLK